MKVLFIGGNGNISWHCVEEALNKGYEVWELNRGKTRKTRRDVQNDVRQIICDVNDKDALKEVLKNKSFDVVCNFICYNSEQADLSIEVFNGLVEQFIFISSESVYKRVAKNLPFKENTEKYSECLQSNYIAGKVAAERSFISAYHERNFPVTIVRPGYTYDTIMPASLGHNCFTLMDCVISGYPMLMYGDGFNLWAPLHSSDFAKAFISLIGNKNVIGDDFHITADELITLNEMVEIVLDLINKKSCDVIHIPYNDVLKADYIVDKEMAKQQMWHYVFDNSKIKNIANGWKQNINFRSGVEKTLEWLMENNVHRRIDLEFKKWIYTLYNRYGVNVNG